MGKRKHFDYIVALPAMNCLGLENIQRLEIVTSTSPRGAVSHALARRVFEKSKGEIIQRTMRQLDKDYGGAGNYAYEIPSGIQEDGIDVPVPALIYGEAQKAFLAEEIVMKTGESRHQCSKTAKQYLNFYNSHS